MRDLKATSWRSREQSPARPVTYLGPGSGGELGNSGARLQLPVANETNSSSPTVIGGESYCPTYLESFGTIGVSDRRDCRFVILTLRPMQNAPARQESAQFGYRY